MIVECMFSSASSLSAVDSIWMQKAFTLAEEALQGDEVPVGCIFVYNSEEIGIGKNEVNVSHDPTRHAEMVAIDRMEKKWGQRKLKEMLGCTTLYVSLEPCIMCAAALYQIGIGKIVYGADNDRFGGMRSVGNAIKYRADPSSIEVVAGVDGERSVRLLRSFYDKQNPYAPDEKRKSKNT